MNKPAPKTTDYPSLTPQNQPAEGKVEFSPFTGPSLSQTSSLSLLSRSLHNDYKAEVENGKHLLLLINDSVWEEKCDDKKKFYEIINESILNCWVIVQQRWTATGNQLQWCFMERLKSQRERKNSFSHDVTWIFSSGCEMNWMEDRAPEKGGCDQSFVKKN